MTEQKWNQGLCGCLSDMKICCCGAFCGPCLMCQNAQDLGKSSCLHCLLYCIFPCLPIFLQRGEARDRYGIEGSVAGDVVASCLCTSCVLCQTTAEIKARDDHN